MTASVVRTRNGIAEWLAVWVRYDAARIEEAEAAYLELVRKGRMGVWTIATLALFAAANIFIPGVANHFVPGMIEIALCVGPIVALCCLSRDTVATILTGVVDWKRACLLGAVLGLAAVALEMSIGTVLEAFGFHGTRHFNVDGGLPLALFGAIVAAPFAEELLMQGWLQTRAMIPSWWSPQFATISRSSAAAQSTTFIFVILHQPRTAVDWVIVIGLWTAATLRATTRSMASCMAIHFTMNSVLIAMSGAVLFLVSQGVHVPEVLR